jgi:heme A synthase
MYIGLLHTHSFLRYVVLILLIIVIVQSLMAWLNRKPYSVNDNRLSLFLFIFTHLQLLIGLILFFVSDWVQFTGEAMKQAETRYWLVEHSVAMIIAIVLITLARTTSKKMQDHTAKHKRMFIFNAIALVIILATIAMSGRGLFGMP